MIVEPTVPREQQHIEDEIMGAPMRWALIDPAPPAGHRLRDELLRLDGEAPSGPPPENCERCGTGGEICWSHTAGAWLCERCHGVAGERRR